METQKKPVDFNRNIGATLSAVALMYSCVITTKELWENI